MKSVKDEGIVTQLAVVATMMPKVKEYIDQQANRIAELEKEVKRLVSAEPITHGKLTFCKNCGQQDPYAQTKPLSDEEIMDIAEQSDYSPVEIEMGYDYEIRIARAIEERHGIK